MQTRALVKERAQRNLLLVIDGIKTEEMLLQGLAGISMADFEALQSLGLIAPVPGTGNVRLGRAPQHLALRRRPRRHRRRRRHPAAPAEAAAPLDYAQFTAALTQMISQELGLRGFVLTLAVEKAGTIEELQAVATRTLRRSPNARARRRRPRPGACSTAAEARRMTRPRWPSSARCTRSCAHCCRCSKTAARNASPVATSTWATSTASPSCWCCRASARSRPQRPPCC